MAAVSSIGPGMRAALAGLAIAVSGCVAPPSEPLPDLRLEDTGSIDVSEAEAAAVLRGAQQMTVRIRTVGCRELGVGSGFVLPGGIVVTNRHVVDQPLAVTINTWDGRSYEVDVVGVAVDSDLAVLQLQDDLAVPEARLRTSPVRSGEPIYVVGYPGGGPLTVSTGEVLGMVAGEMLGEPANVIRVDAAIREGNSGGPLLDSAGDVLGVIFALEVNTGTGLAVPVATLLERLDDVVLAPPAGC